MKCVVEVYGLQYRLIFLSVLVDYCIKLELT